MKSLQNRVSVERIRAELSGRPLARDISLAARMEAAREGKARRPYSLVMNFGEQNDGLLLSGSPVNFRAPFGVGVPRDMLITAFISNAHKSTMLFNPVRRRGLPRGVAEETMLTSPERALYFAGDFNAGTNRVGPSKYFDLPEPIFLKKGEELNVIGVGDVAAGSTVSVSDVSLVGRAEWIYPHDSTEGALTAREESDILEQIETTEQRTFIVEIDVDYSTGAGVADVRLPDLGEWALLLGMASGPVSAGTVFLQWSTIEITDPRENEWSNAPIPILALMSAPADASNKQEFYRELETPYLIAPGRDNQLLYTLAKNAANGVAPEYPPSVVADTTGKLAFIFRTV